MTWQQIDGKWKPDGDQRDFTDKRDQLIADLQEQHGHSREEAEGHVDDWLMSLKDEDATSTSGAPTY